MSPILGLEILLKHISTLWFVGYLPVAPGTWGSLAGLFLIVLVDPSPAVQAVIILAVTVVGVAASTAGERVIGEHDSGHIVIDEVAGFLVSCLLLPHTAIHLGAAFILFRLFDILKPFPVSYLEKTLSRGPGIMADDLMAGVLANLVIQAWMRIW